MTFTDNWLFYSRIDDSASLSSYLVTDLRVIYPYADLMEAKGKLKENIYQKTDTHWNYIGAYVGASALLSELGIELPKIDSEEITIADIGESSGDLANMLNLAKQLRSADREYSVEGYPLHNVEVGESDWGGMWSFRSEGADPKKIYVIRDSFMTHMAQYIGSQFSESYLRHIDSYTYDDLSVCDPDIVVFETVERKAKERLKTFSIQ